MKRLQQLTDIQDASGRWRNETVEEMKKRFYIEIDALWRLDGTVHEHLLTMLTAFEHQGHLMFVFPWAEIHLKSFWSDENSWNCDAATFEWILKQIHGIMGAIDKLHEPTHLHTLKSEPEDRFGLHADIKPDNILLFKSEKHPRGILVVSDFGLSSFHRQVSRSNIPNQKIPGVPEYRPPECDIEGGKISRRYDIWTLGCLFLEMVTWLMGGSHLLKILDEKAYALYITGGQRKMFYQIKEVKEEEDDTPIRREFVRVSTVPSC